VSDEHLQPPLLDTHQHLVYPDRFRYSWTKALPALNGQAFTLEDYWNNGGTKTVSRSLFMETGVDDVYWQDESRYILSLAADPGNRIAGVIAGCRPEHEDAEFDAWLDELDMTWVAGFRRILHTEADELSATSRFTRNVRELGKKDRPFDLCFLERQLPCAISLAKRCDETQLVLDHCGVPDFVSGDFVTWQKHIRQLAALPHVSCKLSGLVAYCPADQDIETAIRPYLEHCADAFGTERLVWGSDWPVCDVTSGLGEWVSMFRNFLAGTSGDTQDAVCRGNAARIYNVRD
jgi:predicted TIM-barrel fold metal-dependent hydrolase